MRARPDDLRAARTAIASCCAVGLFAAALLGAGCSVFKPIEDPAPAPLRADWAVRLYELEPLAYFPRELGQPLHLGEGGADPGVVVVPSADRQVRALDAATGETLWALPTQGPNVAQPVVYGDELLIASMDGRLYRVRQRNGRPVWVSDVIGKGAILEAPAVAGDRAFVTTEDNRISAVSLADGAVLWSRDRAHRAQFTIHGQAGATLVGEHVITGFSDGRVVSFAQSDGATFWSRDLAEGKTEFVDVDTTPVVVGGTVVVGAYRVGLFGLDAETGMTSWVVRGEGFGTPAVMQGVLYVPQSRGRVLAVDPAAGEILWALEMAYGTPRTPVPSYKYLLVPVERSLLVVDRGSGRALARYDDMYGFSARPEVAWGTVYAQANSGSLYAFGLY